MAQARRQPHERPPLAVGWGGGRHGVDGLGRGDSVEDPPAKVVGGVLALEPDQRDGIGAHALGDGSARLAGLEVGGQRLVIGGRQLEIERRGR